MPLLSKQRLVAVAVALGLAVTLLVPIALHSRLNTALDDVEHAKQATVAALDSAAHATQVASAARLQAQRALADRDSAVARAAAADLRAQRARGSYSAAVKVAPDTCRAVIAAADSVISAQDSVASDLRGALASSQDANLHLGIALDTTQAALTRLQGAALPLTHAVSTLEKASHPSLLARLVPHVGLGGAVGIDAFGKPNSVLGITLGWSF